MEESLFDVNPRLSEEWHPTNNGNLKPTDVTAHSNGKVWWICKKSHEWKESISYRSGGSVCPYCSGLHVIPNESDIATLRLDIAAKCHPEHNSDLKPIDVISNSNKKFLWECKKGHQWWTSSNNTSKGNRCPYCD